MEIAALLRLASDQRLAEHISAGSERAFEVLYDRHHRPVLGFCRHMLGSREEAEDALQHTFMAAYRDLRRSGPPAAVRPWLFVIARNRCISMLRARREHPSAELPELSTDHLTAAVAVREELRAVLAAVARLPDDQRAALVLTELGDVSHDEIAGILDCRREQVKSYVYQARATLATDRIAREMPCADIREHLAEMRGGQLRRAPLRRHLHVCVGCREFRDSLRAQRKQLGLLLPVAPSLGLKRAVLGAALGGGGGAGGLSLGGLTATAVLVVAIPAGTAAVASGSDVPAAPAPKVQTTAVSATAAPRAPAASPEHHMPRPARGTEPNAPARTTKPRVPREETPAAEKVTPVHSTAAPAEDRPASAPAQHESTQPASPPAEADEPATRRKPESTPGRSTAPDRGKAPSPPGREKSQAAPGREISQAAPGRERAQAAPGRERAQAAPGRERAQAAPGQTTPDPGPPASPPGQESMPVTPDRPEQAGQPGPPSSPPAQSEAQGPPDGVGPPEHPPGSGNG